MTDASLYRGDALAILRDIPSGSIDALITDPPYSSGGMVRGDRTVSTTLKYTRTNASDATKALGSFTGDNRDARGYEYWLALWLGECLRIVKPSGVALMFTDWRQLPATTDALQSGGWVWRGIVPWFKPVNRPQLGRFTAACEYVVWGSNGGMTTDLGASIPGFYQGSAPRDREHNTQKPLDVMKHLIRICPVGGTVLDPFMGSGTTGVAAVAEGRRFVGVEASEKFFTIAQRRIAEAGALVA